MPLSAEALQPWYAALLDLMLALQAGAWLLRKHVPGGLPRWILPAGLAMLGTCLIALLWSEAAVMGGTSMAEALPAIPLVLQQTGFGHMALVAGLAWCGLLAAWLADKRIVAWLALAVFCCSRAAMGHAMNQGWDSDALWIHALHIAGASSWAGCVFLAAGLIRMTWSPRECRTFAGHLSRVATLALAAVAASGVTDAWRMLGPGGIVLDDPYFRTLVAKLCCVALAIGMGAWNRWRVMPALACDAGAARRFALVLMAEGGVMLVAMVLAAKLGTSMPPMAP